MLRSIRESELPNCEYLEPVLEEILQSLAAGQFIPAGLLTETKNFSAHLLLQQIFNNNRVAQSKPIVADTACDSFPL